MKYCPYCGADIPDGAVSFCAECGKALPAKKEKPENSTPVETSSAGKKKKHKSPKLSFGKRTMTAMTDTMRIFCRSITARSALKRTLPR